MRSLQIFFRLEERKYSPTEDKALTVPFLKALDYLAANDVPIQIFSKRKRPPAIQPTRHAQNRISWLVFIVTSVNSKPVPIWKLISSVQDWSNTAVTSAMFDHLINIVVVHLRASHTEGHGGFNLYLHREHSPFYLMVFNWMCVASNFSHDVWAYDVWLHNIRQRIIGMPEYFKMAEQEGIDGIVKHVTGIRKDFQGDSLAMFVDRGGLNYWWETWKLLMSIPMRHNHGMRRARDYMGRLLMPLGISNNFTFDTITNSNWRRHCQITMWQTMDCVANKRLHDFSSFTIQLYAHKCRHVIPTACYLFVQHFKHEGTYPGLHSLYSSGPNAFGCHSVQVELTEQGLVPHASAVHINVLLSSDICQEKMAVCSVARILHAYGNVVWDVLVK